MGTRITNSVAHLNQNVSILKVCRRRQLHRTLRILRKTTREAIECRMKIRKLIPQKTDVTMITDETMIDEVNTIKIIDLKMTKKIEDDEMIDEIDEGIVS